MYRRCVHCSARALPSMCLTLPAQYRDRLVCLTRRQPLGRAAARLVPHHTLHKAITEASLREAVSVLVILYIHPPCKTRHKYIPRGIVCISQGRASAHASFSVVYATYIQCVACREGFLYMYD